MAVTELSKHAVVRVISVIGLTIILGSAATLVLKSIFRAPGPEETEISGTKTGARGDDAQLWWVPAPSDAVASENYLLETAVYRPVGPGPFPLVTINHGKPSPGSNVRSTRPNFSDAAHWFVERGFVVAVPLRRGYGRSQGEVDDLVGLCADLDYFETARRTAVDLAAVIAFFQKQSFVIPDQVIAVGHSHGAFGLFGLAYEPPPGVIGLLNFAGGTGDWGGIWSVLRHRTKICGGEAKLVAAITNLGRYNRIPQLWLYSKNDKSFGPSLAHTMFEAYSKHSQAPVSFVELTPFQHDGHLLFINGNVSIWGPAVNKFLAGLGIAGYVPWDND
jgi:dienelactone hydrolase